jgi:hypothetical protein
MILYHGTNYASGLAILKNGFQPEETVWNCSDDRMVYLVSEDYDEDKDAAFQFAVNAAQVSAAHFRQTRTELYVFEIDVPDRMIGDIFTEDSSCENMYGCYEVLAKELNNLIWSGSVAVTVHVVHGAFNPYLLPAYLPVENMWLIEDDPLIRDAAGLIRRLDAVYEDLICSDYETESYSLSAYRRKKRITLKTAV